MRRPRPHANFASGRRGSTTLSTKLGAEWFEGHMPLPTAFFRERRASFELVQKAAGAGICACGGRSASSLAELAGHST
jgi:formate dehydrogenase assembly factor FdhD